MAVGLGQAWERQVPGAARGVIHRHVEPGAVAIEFGGCINLAPHRLRMFLCRELCANGEVAVKFEVGEHVKQVGVDPGSVEARVGGMVEPRTARRRQHQGIHVVP